MKQSVIFRQALLLVALAAAACSSGGGEEEYSRFVHLPGHQWLRSVPCYFKPCAEGDGMGIKLSVRHDNEYEYASAHFTVDVLDGDSLVLRRTVAMPLADRNGNWTSEGFGSLYQCQVPVADGVRLDSTSVILVWQSMPCDTLSHISEVGIDITRNK